MSDTHGGGDRSVGACEEEKEKQAKERGFNLNSSLARWFDKFISINMKYVLNVILFWNVF